MSDVIRRKEFPPNITLQLVQGDITKEEVDAIVNAANKNLQHGGGVAAAISSAGGHKIQEESDAWIEEHGSLDHANPAFTSGGELPCEYVIHTVGPRWGSGDEERKLEDAVLGSLRLAEDLGAHSIAFPAISTGIFGFPKKKAAKVIFLAVETYGANHPQSGIRDVRLVLYDKPTLKAFTTAWDREME